MSVYSDKPYEIFLAHTTNQIPVGFWLLSRCKLLKINELCKFFVANLYYTCDICLSKTTTNKKEHQIFVDVL